uniref:Uncharacterized protein n=2 Tax=Viruses TaxID=10239 RepID=A0A8S5RIV1_9VIRU|nr:MAG TPA: hypothetical protein [virus sp. ctML55]DAF44722.1 MAG TPA: hypothetical protein [Podoviridae sp. ct8Lf7]
MYCLLPTNVYLQSFIYSFLILILFQSPSL